MVSRRLISSVVLLGLLTAAPALAADGQRRRGGDERDRSNESSTPRERTGRAVPRSQAQARPDDNGHSAAQQNRQQYRNVGPQYQNVQPQYRNNYQSVQPQYRGGRPYDTRRDYVYRPYQRPYYPYYSNRGYGARTIVVPRYITPRYVTVVPYAPYVYRPSIGLGVYYGSGGAYPYGYTPRGYYEPIPGRAYGGLRLTGASRLAQVFADGYYVGIVNDFDGVFQHLNLEAGTHRMEIVDPGFPPITFDVMIQPGRTMTFRVDNY
jgi:hypothetical protein